MEQTLTTQQKELVNSLIEELYKVNDDIKNNAEEINLTMKTEIDNLFIYIEIEVDDFIDIDCTARLDIVSINKTKKNYKITFGHYIKD